MDDPRQVPQRRRHVPCQRVRVHRPGLAAGPQTHDRRRALPEVEPVRGAQVVRDRAAVGVDQLPAVEPAAVVFWGVRWGGRGGDVVLVWACCGELDCGVGWRAVGARGASRCWLGVGVV